MRQQKSKKHSLKLIPLYLMYLVIFQLAFYYLYHLLRRPYRQNVPAIQYVSKKRNKWIGALYDAMFNLLLDSYEQLTGLKLAPETGQMMFLLIELTRCLDEYLDRVRGLGNESSLNEALKYSPVQEQLEIFRRYLELFGQAKPILTYLKKLFAEYYDVYVHTLTMARADLEFDTILEAICIDTGVWLHSVMKIVALFNAHFPHDEALHNFYLFGVVGKFSDDLLDVVYDAEEGHPNLLYALLCKNESELAIFQLAIKKRKHLDIGWWHKHCPQTYQRYFAYINHYYSQIQSSKLRMACHLMFLPILVALDLDAGRPKDLLQVVQS